MKNQPMKESSYERLNALFESIIAEQENEGTLQNAIEEFFGEYVRAFGGDYSKYKTQVQGYADKIAKSMQNDRAGLMGKLKGGNHLSKATQRLMFELGNVAYSVYRLKPKGAPAASAAPAASKPAAPAKTSTTKVPPEEPISSGGVPLDPNDPNSAALIYMTRAADNLEKLKKANLEAYNRLIKSLGL
jgi:ribosomal protein S17E